MSQVKQLGKLSTALLGQDLTCKFVWKYKKARSAILCRTATSPFVPVLQALATTPCTTPEGCLAQYYAATAYVPLFTQLDNAAAAYETKHGVLYP